MCWENVLWDHRVNATKFCFKIAIKETLQSHISTLEIFGNNGDQLFLNKEHFLFKELQITTEQNLISNLNLKQNCTPPGNSRKKNFSMEKIITLYKN